MSNEIRKEARKQYFRYFRILFIGIGVLLVVTIGLGVSRMVSGQTSRGNFSAPEERVYDYAGVLTDLEEDKLRQRIAEVERERQIDIVLVTFSQSVEGEEAKRQYGYRSTSWEQNMMDLADDFWDGNRYGYNVDFEGDGCILIHNWYEGQNGEHLSTSGRVESRFSSWDIDAVLDRVDAYYATDPYRAYLGYVDEVASLMSGSNGVVKPFSFVWVLVVPLAAALIFAMANLHQKAARNTTTANTYVENGRPVMRDRADDFIRKNVVTRRIQTSSGGGGSHSSGGGGHHISSSGASHGGGSHRH